MQERQLLDIKKDLEVIEKEKNILFGKIQSKMEQLENEFSFSSIEEAEEELKKRKIELQGREECLDSSVYKIIEEYNDRSEDN